MGAGGRDIIYTGHLAQKPQPGITTFTDGSRLDDAAARYAVGGATLCGHRNLHGLKPGSYDADCAALSRSQETATRRQRMPERVTIFADAQAAIRRMASEEPGPGQVYALQARRHIEIRWCPAHGAVPGNEKVGEWAKLAAEEPDARWVEWLGYSD